MDFLSSRAVTNIRPSLFKVTPRSCATRPKPSQKQASHAIPFEQNVTFAHLPHWSRPSFSFALFTSFEANSAIICGQQVCRIVQNSRLLGLQVLLDQFSSSNRDGLDGWTGVDLSHALVLHIRCLLDASVPALRMFTLDVFVCQIAVLDVLPMPLRLSSRSLRCFPLFICLEFARHNFGRSVCLVCSATRKHEKIISFSVFSFLNFMDSKETLDSGLRTFSTCFLVQSHSHAFLGVCYSLYILFILIILIILVRFQFLVMISSIK